MGRWIPVTTAVLSGVLFGWFASPDAFKPAASLLATFSGFISAAIVPTMILAATIIRPARFGLAALRNYREALRLQLNFFAGVLVVAAALIAILVAGEMVGWKDHHWNIGNHTQILISRAVIVNGLLGFLSTLLFFRVFGFVNGVRSLFELHFSMVEQEAADRVKSETERLFSADQTSRNPRPNFGRVLKTNSQPR